jgi:hypothetical protein
LEITEPPDVEVSQDTIGTILMQLFALKLLEPAPDDNSSSTEDSWQITPHGKSAAARLLAIRRPSVPGRLSKKQPSRPVDVSACEGTPRDDDPVK